jgi:hypothetical protein
LLSIWNLLVIAIGSHTTLSVCVRSNTLQERGVEVVPTIRVSVDSFGAAEGSGKWSVLTTDARISKSDVSPRKSSKKSVMFNRCYIRIMCEFILSI